MCKRRGGCRQYAHDPVGRWTAEIADAAAGSQRGRQDEIKNDRNSKKQKKRQTIWRRETPVAGKEE